MANRYMNTFRDEILGWNKKLMNVADVNQIMTEIQRTWAYLESLFIHSEEVKKELPEAAVRFANIDREVKIILKVLYFTVRPVLLAVSTVAALRPVTMLSLHDSDSTAIADHQSCDSGLLMASTLTTLQKLSVTVCEHCCRRRSLGRSRTV